MAPSRISAGICLRFAQHLPDSSARHQAVSFIHRETVCLVRLTAVAGAPWWQHFPNGLKNRSSRDPGARSGKRKGLLLNSVGVIPGEVPRAGDRSTRAFEAGVFPGQLENPCTAQSWACLGIHKQVHNRSGFAVVPWEATEPNHPQIPDTVGSDERLQLGRQTAPAAGAFWGGWLAS